MANLMSNIPYGKIMSTIKDVYSFARPAAMHMAAGAAIGAAGSVLSGDRHMGRDAVLGAAGGLGYRSIGKTGGLRDAFKAATSTKGVLNMGASYNSMRSAAQMSWHWRGLGL